MPFDPLNPDHLLRARRELHQAKVARVEGLQRRLEPLRASTGKRCAQAFAAADHARIYEEPDWLSLQRAAEDLQAQQRWYDDKAAILDSLRSGLNEEEAILDELNRSLLPEGPPAADLLDRLIAWKTPSLEPVQRALAEIDVRLGVWEASGKRLAQLNPGGRRASAAPLNLTEGAK